MRKKWIPHIFAVITLVVFIVLGLASAATKPYTTSTPAVSTPAVPEKWKFGQFTNEWGDAIDNYYMQYVNDIAGVYSNSYTNNSPLRVSTFVFSKDQGLFFELFERGSPVISQYSEINFSLLYNSQEKQFKGASAGATRFVLPFNDELVDIFSLENDVSFRVTAKAPLDDTSYYQFVFNASGFKNAYDKLMSYGNQSSSAKQSSEDKTD